MKYLIITILMISLSFPNPAKAEFDWASYTLDNDFFLGKDNGYTNGLYISLYDLEENGEQPLPSWMLKPLRWSLSTEKRVGAVNSYTIGQTMVTPEDISLEIPSEFDLPYAGLLYVGNTYLTINEEYADEITTIIGVVGPLSLAEGTQKIIHQLISSDEPQGWDTQLKNELVFQFERGRAWRNWESDNQSWDLVTTGEVSVGTLASGLNAGVMLRYGSQLISSYATTLFTSSKTTNPVANNGGWNIYFGLNAGYTFNQIFTDGNTFRSSRSIDYDHEKVGVTLGFTYSWEGSVVAFALNDTNIISKESEQELQDLTQYGTFTFAIEL